MKYFVSPTGNDSNAGTSAAPFATVGRGVAQLQPGDRLLLRGGTYVERVVIDGSALDLDGSEEPPATVIMSAPGERAVVDGASPAFQMAPNHQWDPIGTNGEFVSRHVFPRGAARGSFVDRSTYTRLVAYWSIDDLRATNQGFGPLPDDGEGPIGHEIKNPRSARLPMRPLVYMGPGVIQDEDGHIHIRLSHTTHGSKGMGDYTEEQDPRKLRLAIWTTDSPTIEVTRWPGLHLRNLTIRHGGGRTIRLVQANGTLLDHVRILAGAYALEIGDGCENTSVRHCELDGGLPPWFFRSDRKDGYIIAATGEENKLGERTAKTLLYCSPLSRNTRIDHCEIVNGHDMQLAGTGVAFTRNWVSNLNDDALFIGRVAERVHIHENVFQRSLTLLSVDPESDRGHVYFYRNLVDLRSATAGRRPHPRPDAIVAADKLDLQVRRYGQMFKSTPPDPPVDLFHNTLLVTRQTQVSSYPFFVQYDGLTQRRSFNNIFIAFNPVATADKPIAFLPTPTQPGISDGNCYHRIGQQSAPAFRHKKYAPTGPTEYPHLDAVRGSVYFEDSKAQYPPGCEAQGLSESPQLRAIRTPLQLVVFEDFRLRASSPARNHGAFLPDDLQDLDNETSFAVSKDMGCYPFDVAPLRVGVDGRRQFPAGFGLPPLPAVASNLRSRLVRLGRRVIRRG